MQAALLAPGILGAGVAALSQDSDSQRSAMASFGTPVIGQQSMLQSGQFSLNGLNGVGNLMQPHMQALGHTVSALSPLSQNLNSTSLPSLSSLATRSKESWNQQEQNRIDQTRFAGRSNQFNNQEYGGSGGYRGVRPNSLFINKVQELEGRRNPHAFQAGASNFGNFDNDRQSSGRKSGNSSRFSSESKNGTSSGHCVEVRNMPLNATYADLRHAFQGIYIRKDGMKIINDNHGNRVGIAYIKFGKTEGKELALSTTRYVRGSEVEVLHLDENIFDKAVNSYSPDKEDVSESDLRNSTCILLTDLPSFTKEMDIAKLFHDWKINDLFITSSKESGVTQCIAYVQFARLEDAKSSLSTSLKIGSKQVTATAISEEKFAQVKREHEQANMNQTDCILMRGLPFQTTDRDIFDFFSDIGIVPVCIHMMLNQQGKAAGECFCEFDSTEKAERAISKNGLPLGKNVPTIELVLRAKMLETLGMMEAQQQQQQHFPPIQEQHQRPPRFSGPLGHLPRFGNTGFGPRCPPGMMGMPRHMMGRHPPSLDYVEGFGKPGCVLSLENVPFKADINEIIEFFGDFDVKRENVIRRYNERGMPTGDARVAFSSPSEAQRALKELKHCKMRERTIYMKLA